MTLTPRIDAAERTQYVNTEQGGTVTVTPSTSFLNSNYRVVFVPYQTFDGTWRCTINAGGQTTAATATFTLTVTGLTFKDVTGGDYNQPVTVEGGGATSLVYRGTCTSNTGVISMTCNISSDKWAVTGDVELDGKPSWAT